jgi:flagellar biosynthesis anti-sigma factor FlgM
MTYTGGIGNSTPLTSEPSVSGRTTGAIPASARTEASTPTTGPRSAAVDEIAGDSAKLSLAGAMLSQASSGSDVRFDKVAELRQSIEAGTYSVSPQDVATKLIDTLQK